MKLSRPLALLALAAMVALVLALPTMEPVASCIRSAVWPRSLLALTVVADAMIAMAYAWIPVTLLGVWRRRRDVPVSWTLVSFAAFIVLCGLTHVMAIVTAFHPIYWLAAEIDLATAGVSLATAYLLQTRVGPLLLTLKSYGDVVAEVDAAKGESEELRAAKLAAEVLAQELAAAKTEADMARAAAEQSKDKAVGEVVELQRALDDLQRAEGTIARQRVAITELSTPILHIWAGVLALPIVGMVDSPRAADMTEALLDEIARTGARYTIVDVTGVGVMDTGTVAHIAAMARAAGLMGSACVITGIRPDVARTLVASAVDLGGAQTLHSLEQGLRWCLAKIGKATG